MPNFKKITLLLTVLSTFAFAELNFVKDYKTAIEKAQSEDKKILLMLSKKECPACWWMKNVAFKDEALAKRINENLIAVVVDVEKEEIPMNLEFIGTPTFYFLNKKQDQLSRIDGARNVKQFNDRLDILLD